MNIKKCTFCAPFGILLGHVVCHDQIFIDPSKIVIIVDLPLLTIVNKLRTNLGHILYYQNFIRGYVEVSAPMEKLIKKDVKF